MTQHNNARSSETKSGMYSRKTFIPNIVKHRVDDDRQICYSAEIYILCEYLSFVPNSVTIDAHLITNDGLFRHIYH